MLSRGPYTGALHFMKHDGLNAALYKKKKDLESVGITDVL